MTETRNQAASPGALPASDAASRRFPAKSLLGISAAVTLVFALLAFLPGRRSIPPQVESDYCYSLLSAERFEQGQGFTSLDPVAPFQPWEYRADFVFLTKWPVGYPFIVWLVGALAGCSTLAAAVWIAVGCNALALTGWYAWTRGVTGKGWISALAAMTVASCSVTVGGLLHPRTDTVITALMPWLLLMAARTIESGECGLEHDPISPSSRRGRARVVRISVLGLLFGSLVWFRYAAVFAAVGWMVALALKRRRAGIGLPALLACGIACIAPGMALIGLNQALGVDVSTQAQLNLGRAAQWNFDASLLATAWIQLTHFGWYAYRPESRLIWTAAPAAALLLTLIRLGRGSLRGWRPRAELVLALTTLGALLAELVLATTLFGGKYHYVALERYYEPVRPLLLSLCAWGLLGNGGLRAVAGAAALGALTADSRPGVRLQAIRGLFQRGVRVGAAVSLAVILHWNVAFSWPHDYQHARLADRARTPSGAWAQAFIPGSEDLYRRLRQVDPDKVILFSNFHEFLAFEVGAAAYPLPADRATALRWISAIGAHRSTPSPQVWFVLDRDNRWREAWQPGIDETIARLSLVPVTENHPGASWRIFRFEDEIDSASISARAERSSSP